MFVEGSYNFMIFNINLMILQSVLVINFEKLERFPTYYQPKNSPIQIKKKVRFGTLQRWLSYVMCLFSYIVPTETIETESKIS